MKPAVVKRRAFYKPNNKTINIIKTIGDNKMTEFVDKAGLEVTLNKVKAYVDAKASNSGGGGSSDVSWTSAEKQACLEAIEAQGELFLKEDLSDVIDSPDSSKMDATLIARYGDSSSETFVFKFTNTNALTFSKNITELVKSYVSTSSANGGDEPLGTIDGITVTRSGKNYNASSWSAIGIVTCDSSNYTAVTNCYVCNCD